MNRIVCLLALTTLGCRPTADAPECVVSLECGDGRQCVSGRCIGPDAARMADAGADASAVVDGGSADTNRLQDGGVPDAGRDARSTDAGSDTRATDAGADARATDAGADAAHDVGMDTSADAPSDAGADAHD